MNVLNILGEAILLATFQPSGARRTGAALPERVTEPPARYRPERKADRKRVW